MRLVIAAIIANVVGMLALVAGLALDIKWLETAGVWLTVPITAISGALLALLLAAGAALPLAASLERAQSRRQS